MIKARELRIGNLVTWNRALVSPTSTLPPMQIEVAAILADRINYVFPNIENRVEPFEDDVAQSGVRFKMLEEIEPIVLTAELLKNIGFEEKEGKLVLVCPHIHHLQLSFDDTQLIYISLPGSNPIALSVKFFHQLQNLFFAITGEELRLSCMVSKHKQ